MIKQFKYFESCTTVQQVKKEFRKLSAIHSPRTLDQLADKEKTVIMQMINEQRSEALKRISISEGRAPSYYEELEAKVKQGDFGAILKAAAEIEEKLSKSGNNSTSFKDVFKSVSEMFFEPKKENAIEPKSPGALPDAK